jgi:hypothetical protein
MINDLYIYVSKVLLSFVFNDKYEVVCVKQAFDEDSNLDFFEQIVDTTKPMKILVTKELLIFRCY